jgi:hypothetical protein
VLAGAGLRDHPRLAHLLGEQRLTQHVAHLVRAGVVQVLALEQHLGADRGGEPLGLVEQGRRARVVAEQAGEPRLEDRVDLGRPVRRVQLVERPDQGLGHEPPAVPAEVPGQIRQRRRAHCLPPLRGSALVRRRAPDRSLTVALIALAGASPGGCPR